MSFDVSEYLQEMRDIHSRTFIRKSMVQDKARIAELESVVGYLLVSMIHGKKPSLDDEAVRRFLRLPKEIKDPEKALQLVLSKLEPNKKLLECKQCGAKCKDIAGFTNEECVFCGADVGSES